MSLLCECGADFDLGNVDVATATCASCGATRSVWATPFATAIEASPVAIPDAFTSTPLPGLGASYRSSARERMRWTYRWFHPQWVAGLVISVCAAAGSSHAIIGSLSGGPASGAAFLFLAMAAYGGYWSVAHLLNRSTIHLGPAGLAVTCGPIPWRGMQQNRTDITGFDFRRGTGRSVRAWYEVFVIDRWQNARVVVTRMSMEEASYLTGELRECLGRGSSASTPER